MVARKKGSNSFSPAISSSLRGLKSRNSIMGAANMFNKFAAFLQVTPPAIMDHGGERDVVGGQIQAPVVPLDFILVRSLSTHSDFILPFARSFAFSFFLPARWFGEAYLDSFSLLTPRFFDSSHQSSNRVVAQRWR
jgi:hypothetical protein